MLQRHLQDTYEYLFDRAHDALKEGGSFAPFGAGIRKTGEQIHTNVDLPIDKSAPSDHISGLIAFFRADESEHGLIAAGLVFDGRSGSDGAQGVEVVVPYARRSTSEIAFDEPKITPVQAEIFTDVM
jgi:hypothetical protein